MEGGIFCISENEVPNITFAEPLGEISSKNLYGCWAARLKNGQPNYNIYTEATFVGIKKDGTWKIAYVHSRDDRLVKIYRRVDSSDSSERISEYGYDKKGNLIKFDYKQIPEPEMKEVWFHVRGTVIIGVSNTDTTKRDVGLKNTRF